MKKLLWLSSVLLLLLAACGTNDASKDKNSKSNTENKQTSAQNSNNKDKKIEKEIAKLSEKERLALVFCVDDVDQYTLTKNEILTGIYEYKMPTGKRNYNLVDFTLVKYKDKVKNVPKNMNFYTVYPNKGNFITIVGVNKDKIFVGRDQATEPTYKAFLEKGKEIDLKEVYKHNKDNKAMSELVSKMNISDKLPSTKEERENPLSDKNLEKSGSVGTQYRNQVYKLISNFDDVQVGKTGYLWDNVKNTNHKGDWKVNYRNNNGEILGTYVMEDGKMSKLDDKGKVIKTEKKFGYK